MAWLVGMTLMPLIGAALLGHLDRIGSVAGDLWHRLRPPPPRAETQAIEALAADLRRLAAGLERAYLLDEPAKMARLTAAALAYDWVLLSAARSLEVPVPDSVPLDPVTRLETEAALAAQGLLW